MSKMKATLIASMGSDLTVVNAARVSFNSHSDELNKKDNGLITFLSKHGHWSPFAHVQLTLRVKAPIFVARQLVKHQVGLTWNEISRRYVDTDIEFYEPEVWRKAADSVKQGSSDTPIQHNGVACDTYRRAMLKMTAEYKSLLSMGVCMEQARMLLPQSMMTEWYWSGSLFAFAKMCSLRCKDDTQAETRVVADAIDEEMENLYPMSWESLREYM